MGLRPCLHVGTTNIALALTALIAGGQSAAADDRSELIAAFNRSGELRAKFDGAGAIREMKRAVKLADKIIRPPNEDTAVLLNNLAMLYDDVAQYAEAAEVMLRSLKIYEAKLGRNHYFLATGLNSLGATYKRMGDYRAAEKYYLRGLQITKAKYGPESPEVAKIWRDLGDLELSRGKYALAESYLLRSLRVREAKLGANHVETADTVHSLGAVYRAMGQPRKAEPYLQRAVAIRQALLGQDHMDVAASLGTLAGVLSDMGQNAQAMPLCLKSVQIYWGKVGPEHPFTATGLNDLATLYDVLGHHADAAPLYERGLKAYQKMLGRNHPHVATVLVNLANLNARLGQYATAEPRLQRALKLDETKLGPNHPRLARTLESLAKTHAVFGDTGAAVEEFERARRIVRQHVSSVLPVLSEQEQLAFLDNTDRVSLHMALSLALQRPNATVAERSAGWLANGKAVAQNSLAERAQIARDQRDRKLAVTIEELQKIRTRLASLALTGPTPGQETAGRTELDKLSSREQSLAKQLAQSRGQAARSDPWVAIATIRKSLPRDGVLIDIARLDLYEFARANRPTAVRAKTSQRNTTRSQAAPKNMPERPERFLGPHYVAWVVPPAGQGNVVVVNLGPAHTIDSAVAAYQAAMIEAQTGQSLKALGEAAAAEQFAQPLANLGRLVLEPLAPHLKSSKQLVLSPDGALWLVPWAALPVGNTQFAVERWQMRYVVAGREVALERLRPASAKPNSPRLFANPDYDLEPDDAMLAYQAIFRPSRSTRNAPAPRTPGASRGNQLLAMRSRALFGRVERLPGTAVEAASIAPKLKLYTKTEPRSYLDRQAQEGVFKRLRSPRVLLLSTHGFFLTDQLALFDGGASQVEGRKVGAVTTDQQGNPLENPLLRCGLLFAGCNQRAAPRDPTLDDGVLTGLEIVGTNLRGTELVVLSACETGLGRVNNGEGVSGLRQAFQLAGARSVVSTLWQIPDNESAELMTRFFGNLAAGQSKAAALRSAQLKMIDDRRERYGAAHPLFWAAFTVTGN